MHYVNECPHKYSCTNVQLCVCVCSLQSIPKHKMCWKTAASCAADTLVESPLHTAHSHRRFQLLCLLRLKLCVCVCVCMCVCLLNLLFTWTLVLHLTVVVAVDVTESDQEATGMLWEQVMLSYSCFVTRAPMSHTNKQSTLQCLYETQFVFQPTPMLIHCQYQTLIVTAPPKFVERVTNSKGVEVGIEYPDLYVIYGACCMFVSFIRNQWGLSLRATSRGERSEGIERRMNTLLLKKQTLLSCKYIEEDAVSVTFTTISLSQHIQSLFSLQESEPQDPSCPVSIYIHDWCPYTVSVNIQIMPLVSKARKCISLHKDRN